MSNQATATATSGGTSIVGLLGIVFVVLKLTGVIDWSWWLVLLPFYGGLLLLLAIAGIGLLVYGGAKFLDGRAARKRAAARKTL